MWIQPFICFVLGTGQRAILLAPLLVYQFKHAPRASEIQIFKYLCWQTFLNWKQSYIVYFRHYFIVETYANFLSQELVPNSPNLFYSGPRHSVSILDKSDSMKKTKDTRFFTSIMNGPFSAKFEWLYTL